MGSGKWDVSKMRELKPSDFNRKYTPRMLLHSITLPSQYAAYAVCTEFAKLWFLEKFPEHFFNSIYVDGTHSFDEFRKFSDINQKLKRANPLLAIVPSIDIEHNRNWIDVNPEVPMMLRRARMEGTFFNDIRENRGLHLQIQFKTILMNFTYKIRLNTKGEALDMLEFIKFKHRAGMTDSKDLTLDIHVPKQIISQIAWDNDIRMYEDGTPVDSIQMLQYLNAHSYIPFLYKLRCATGNNEYFIKVPNCVAYIETQLPSMDDGERQNMLSTNFNVEFNIKVEMTAPYCYTYYSQHEQKWIKNKPIQDTNGYYIGVMMATKTEIPPEDEHHWKMIGEEPIQYVVEKEDLYMPLDIDFKSEFKDSDIGRVIKYTMDLYLNPYLFINFRIFNDGQPCEYEMDWNTLIMHLKEPITNLTTVIAIYCDLEYINNTIIHLDELNGAPTRT